MPGAVARGGLGLVGQDGEPHYGRGSSPAYAVEGPKRTQMVEVCSGSAGSRTMSEASKPAHFGRNCGSLVATRGWDASSRCWRGIGIRQRMIQMLADLTADPNPVASDASCARPLRRAIRAASPNGRISGQVRQRPVAAVIGVAELLEVVAEAVRQREQ